MTPEKITPGKITPEKKMPDKKLNAFNPLMFTLMLCLAFAVFMSGGHRKPVLIIGKTISPFDIAELGKPDSHFTPKAWEGKVVIVNIFASWCEPCQAEHRLLLKLSKNTKVPIYGIAWKDRESNITNWLDKHGNPYAMVALDRGGDVTVPFAMTGVPETYIIGKDGIVYFHFSSSMTEDVLEEQLMPVLEELAPSHPGKAKVHANKL